MTLFNITILSAQYYIGFIDKQVQLVFFYYSETKMFHLMQKQLMTQCLENFIVLNKVEKLISRAMTYCFWI